MLSLYERQKKAVDELVEYLKNRCEDNLFEYHSWKLGDCPLCNVFFSCGFCLGCPMEILMEDTIPCVKFARKNFDSLKSLQKIPLEHVLSFAISLQQYYEENKEA